MAKLSETLSSYWEGISERERRTIALGGVGAVAILLLYVGLAVYDGLVALEQKNLELRRALTVMQTLRAQGGLRRDEGGPTLTNEPVKLESYLDNAAQKTGVTIPSFTPRPEARRDGVLVHMMTIEPRSLTIVQARDLLRTIEQDNRTVAVTNLAINRNFSDQEKVDLKIEVSAFALDAPAAGSDAPAGNGAGNGGAVAGRTP